MYMQIVAGRFVEAFCKNTVYRFLNAAKTNWKQFVCALSEKIINRTICHVYEADQTLQVFSAR